MSHNSPRHSPRESVRAYMLVRALAAFDEARTRRRARRRAAAVGVSLALILAVVVVAWPTRTAESGAHPGITHVRVSSAAANSGYPACVEVLHTQYELLQAIQDFGACEGIGVDGGRIFIVECAGHPDSPPA
jgi:hypothetical protein